MASTIAGGKSDYSRAPNAGNPGYYYYQGNPGLWDAYFGATPMASMPSATARSNYPAVRQPAIDPVMAYVAPTKGARSQAKTPAQKAIRTIAGGAKAPSFGRAQVGSSTYAVAPGYIGGYAPTPAGPGFATAGGAGGSSGKWLCGAYNALGWLPDDIYAADLASMARHPDEVRAGYSLWAKPLADFIRDAGPFNFLLRIALWPFVRSWARHMAGEKAPLGALMEMFGIPLCAFLGRAAVRVRPA